MFFFHFACGDAIGLHFVKWQNWKFNGLKSCTVRNMVTDIQYSNSGISYLLSMDSKAMTEGVTCFPNIFFVTAFAFNYINKVFNVAWHSCFYLFLPELEYCVSVTILRTVQDFSPLNFQFCHFTKCRPIALTKQKWDVCISSNIYFSCKPMKSGQRVNVCFMCYVRFLASRQWLI